MRIVSKILIFHTYFGQNGSGWMKNINEESYGMTINGCFMTLMSKKLLYTYSNV